MPGRGPGHCQGETLVLSPTVCRVLPGGMVCAQVTPFLLERIRQLTSGKSLEANVKLVKNNAQVGASVARALAQLNAAATASKL
eukprot:362150-Chlamydomonas_euryale.AAC.5